MGTKFAATLKKSKGTEGAVSQNKSKKSKGDKSQLHKATKVATAARTAKQLCTQAAKDKAAHNLAATNTVSLPIPPPRIEATATTNPLAQYSIEELTLALNAKRREFAASEAGLAAKLMVMDQQAATAAAASVAPASATVDTALRHLPQPLQVNHVPHLRQSKIVLISPSM